MAQSIPSLDHEPWDRRDVLPIVALICSIVLLLLFALATPSPGFTKSRGGTPIHKSCVANLKQLSGAKEAYAEERGLRAGVALPEGCLWARGGFLKSEPTCPAGGEYALGVVGETPRCSAGGRHSLE